MSNMTVEVIGERKNLSNRSLREKKKKKMYQRQKEKEKIRNQTNV